MDMDTGPTVAGVATTALVTSLGPLRATSWQHRRVQHGQSDGLECCERGAFNKCLESDCSKKKAGCHEVTDHAEILFRGISPEKLLVFFLGGLLRRSFLSSFLSYFLCRFLSYFLCRFLSSLLSCLFHSLLGYLLSSSFLGFFLAGADFLIAIVALTCSFWRFKYCLRRLRLMTLLCCLPIGND